MILRKINKIGATKCLILRLKCTKFDFRWGSAPDPAGGSLQRSPTTLAVFKGPTCKGSEGKGREREEKRRGRLPLQLGTLDPTLEEGKKGRRARRENWLGRPGTSFFHFKYCLRSTMGQQRLTDFSIINIERGNTNAVMKNQMTEIIDIFGRRKNRHPLFLTVYSATPYHPTPGNWLTPVLRT